MERLSLDDDSIDDDDVWQPVEAFFDRHGLAQHHVDSFNRFITHDIPTVVEENMPIVVDVGDRRTTIRFREVYVDRPVFKEVDDPVRVVYPKQCVDRNITYEAPAYADIEVVNALGVTVVYPKHHFANIPIMVGSERCNLHAIGQNYARLAELGEDLNDPGGYFVTKGTKRIIATQERASLNHVYVFTRERKTSPKYTTYAEVRSCASSSSTSTVVGFIESKREPIGVTLPYNDILAIPLAVVFYALGATSTEEILCHVLPVEIETPESAALISQTIEYSHQIHTQTDALSYIGWKMGKTGPTMVEKREALVKACDVVTATKKRSATMQKVAAALKKVKTATDDDAAKVAAEVLILMEGRKEASEVLRVLAIFKSVGPDQAALDMLTSDFLPHLGSDLAKKRLYLGYMVQKALRVYVGLATPEDRDHYANKRVFAAGTLLAEQFHIAFRRMRKEMIKAVEKSVAQCNSYSISIKPGTISSSLHLAISDNKWGSRGDEAEGVSQPMETFNHLSKISCLRKLSVPMKKGGKVIPPRNLHASHFGIVGAFETPESEKTGLIKFIGLLGYVSVGCDSNAIREVVQTMNVSPPNADVGVRSIRGKFIVSLDGDWLGHTSEPYEVINQLRGLRRSGDLNFETSISFDPRLQEVKIYTGQGRMMRPLFVVESGCLLFRQPHLEKLRSGEWTWSHLLSHGLIEMIDKAEESHAKIVFYPSDLDTMSGYDRSRVTHCELHPSCLSSTSDSIIPFLNRNQAPRNTYEAQQGKQAIGIPGLNYALQMKGAHHYMYYVQEPLLATRMARMIRVQEQPMGVNAMVMVAPWQGFNQEDSLVFNQDSIDRGFMRVVKILTYDTTLRVVKDNRTNEPKERLEVPNPATCNNFKGSADKLEEDGIVAVGTIVEEDDILIGKVTTVDETSSSIHRKPYTDRSERYDQIWPGTVTAVQRGTNADGFEYVRVQVSQVRKPVIGDKVSSRHGQKGTCGMLYRSYDLPFTRDGSVPDLMMNPLALPSRMTIAQLVECLAGKRMCVSPLSGVEIRTAFENDPDADGTPFNRDFSLERICKQLKEMGYNEFGYETVTNGMTGETMPCMLFFGPVYYQRLKHMVIDKVHSRNRKGGRTAMTRQPREGRARKGGLKCGTMEKDNILAQGCSGFVRDRLMEQSDDYRMWVCSVCGIPVVVDKSGRQHECPLCNSNEASSIRIPFATKLLTQELATANIVTRMVVKPFSEPQMEVDS